MRWTIWPCSRGCLDERKEIPVEIFMLKVVMRPGTKPMTSLKQFSIQQIAQIRLISRSLAIFAFVIKQPKTTTKQDSDPN